MLQIVYYVYTIMIIIAHRGLVQGPNSDLENEPQHIQQLLNAGWHVEIDVRHQLDGWYLGHDHAQYPVSVEFLLQPRLWIHVKDTSASTHMMQLQQSHHHLNFFWHESDSRTLTSQHYWWTQPGHDLVYRSVAVMPEWCTSDVTECVQWPCVAVCTDWGSKLR